MFAVVRCCPTFSSYKLLIKPHVWERPDWAPVPVSTAWRSTCCHTARRGSTNVTSALKLLTGSPTWYATKCHTTVGSTTSVRTVPRYSEFTGCLLLLGVRSSVELGFPGHGIQKAVELLLYSRCLFFFQEITLLLYKCVIFLPVLIWKWLWSLKLALMCRMLSNSKLRAWCFVRSAGGSLRSKKPQENARWMGSLKVP